MEKRLNGLKLFHAVTEMCQALNCRGKKGLQWSYTK